MAEDIGGRDRGTHCRWEAAMGGVVRDEREKSRVKHRKWTSD